MAWRITGTKPLSDQIVDVFQYYVLFYSPSVVATTYISWRGMISWWLDSVHSTSEWKFAIGICYSWFQEFKQKRDKIECDVLTWRDFVTSYIYERNHTTPKIFGFAFWRRYWEKINDLQSILEITICHDLQTYFFVCTLYIVLGPCLTVCKTWTGKHNGRKAAAWIQSSHDCINS